MDNILLCNTNKIAISIFWTIWIVINKPPHFLFWVKKENLRKKTDLNGVLLCIYNLKTKIVSNWDRFGNSFLTRMKYMVKYYLCTSWKNY